jgi:hypothetical protein
VFLKSFITDAKRFVQYNRQMIEEAPLQLYLSALLFAPATCLIRKTFFEHLPSRLHKLAALRSFWSPASLSIPSPEFMHITSLVYSPDGDILAAATKKEVKV